MMYERLAKLKRLDEEMRNNPDKGKKMNSVALELGLYSNRFDGKGADIYTKSHIDC